MSYKHIRVKEETHNKLLKIKGFYATRGIHFTIQELIDKMFDMQLDAISKEG